MGISSKLDIMYNYDREINYDIARYGTKGGQFLSRVELENTLGMLRGGNVLHAGIATGRVAVFLTSRGFDYVGIEISDTMSRVTKERLNGIGNVTRGDAECLPFRDEVFDNVVSVRAIQFFPNPGAFVADAHRVLKKGGRMIVSFEKRVRGRSVYEKLKRIPEPPFKINYASTNEVVSLLERSHFKVLCKKNVLKMPMIVYRRFKTDGVLRAVHDYIPSWFGTVSVVVGEKK